MCYFVEIVLSIQNQRSMYAGQYKKLPILKSGNITTAGVPKPVNTTVPSMLSPKGGVKYKILILVWTLARETV